MYSSLSHFATRHVQCSEANEPQLMNGQPQPHTSSFTPGHQDKRPRHRRLQKCTRYIRMLYVTTTTLMFCPTMDLLLKCHYLPKIIQQPQIFVQNAKYVLSSCTYCCCLTQEFINPFFCDLNESTILRLSLRFMKTEEMSIRNREIQQCVQNNITKTF